MHISCLGLPWRCKVFEFNHSKRSGLHSIDFPTRWRAEPTRSTLSRFLDRLGPVLSGPSSRILLDRHATDRFRQRTTGLLEQTFHRGGSCSITDSLKERNAKGTDGVAAIVQNRERNVDYTLYLITFSLVKSTLSNLGQVLAQISRRVHSIVLT